MISLAYGAGLRVSEIINLKVRDVDLDELTIRAVAEFLPLILVKFNSNVIIGIKVESLFINQYSYETKTNTKIKS